MQNDPVLDVITIGRCSVDLYGQQIGGRLEDMSSFAKYVGGCPANIAIGTARLGLRSGFISKVGDEHMGRFIQETMRAEGVDTRHLTTDPQCLTALVILGIRNQNNFPLIFYRENCADMALSEADIDPAYIASAKAVVLTGTHFSTPAVDAMSRKAASAARAAGRKVILDIDYRPVLWKLTGHGLGEERFIASRSVTDHIQSVLPLCDVIVGTEEEFHIAGGSESTIQALKQVREITGAVLVCKRGPLGCAIFPEAIPETLDEGLAVAGQPIDVYNVLGAGDAFMSGLLRGYLRGEDWQTAGRYANACGALVVSRHGCAPAMPSWTEMDHYVRNGSTYHALRDDPNLNHLHWAATRQKQNTSLFALAIDHRAQFEELADRCGAPYDRIGQFKLLALEAARILANDCPGFGMLLDDRYGRAALHEAGDGSLWIGRPVEKPGSRPLRFEPGPDIGSALIEWPARHVVKCLVFYHPDDEKTLRLQQEETVTRLFHATRATGHELLLEVIAGKHGPLTVETVPVVLDRFYSLGIRPDWWKLEPLSDPLAWRAIGKVIDAYDPLCRGIVMLGLEQPEADLVKAFKAAIPNAPVKGFAIGRTVFASAAEQWLQGKITDREAVTDMVRRFQSLLNAWHEISAHAPASA